MNHPTVPARNGLSPRRTASTCSLLPQPCCIRCYRNETRRAYPCSVPCVVVTNFCLPTPTFLFLQDISEDLKLSLNDRIELALADQGWHALAAQLGRNDHLNVRK